MLKLFVVYVTVVSVLLAVAVFVPTLERTLLLVALGVAVVGAVVIIYYHDKIGESKLRQLVRLYLQRLEQMHDDFDARRKFDGQVSDLARYIHESFKVGAVVMVARKKQNFAVAEVFGVVPDQVRQVNFGHRDDLIRVMETRRSVVSLRKVYPEGRSSMPLQGMPFEEALPVLAGGRCTHFILLSRSSEFSQRLLRPFLLALADQIGSHAQTEETLVKHNQQMAKLRKQLDSTIRERDTKVTGTTFDARAMIAVQDRFLRIHSRDQLYDSLLHLFKEQFKVDFVAILHKNPESGAHEVKYSHNVSKDRAVKITWGAESGFDASLRSTPGWMRVDRLPEAVKESAVAVFLRESGVVSLGALGEQDESEGVMVVGRQKGAFSDEELEAAYSYCRLFDLVLENHAHFEKIEQMSYTDSMTGLYNYRYFYKRLQEEITRAKRFDRRLALVIFDIDEFKVFNDTYGHQSGDYLLEQLGSMLAKSVRSIDVVSRYGGEEFCVIMPETSADDCLNFMDRMRVGVENHEFRNRFTSERHRISVSLGGAIYPNDAQRIDRLIYCADMALLQAKSTGRNRAVMFDEKLLDSRNDSYDKKINE